MQKAKQRRVTSNAARADYYFSRHSNADLADLHISVLYFKKNFRKFLRTSKWLSTALQKILCYKKKRII